MIRKNEKQKKLFWISAIAHTGIGYYDYELTRILSDFYAIEMFVPVDYLFADKKQKKIIVRAFFGKYHKYKNNFFKILQFIYGYLRIVIECMKEYPEIVHIQMSVLPPLDVLFSLLLRFLRIPVIFTPHDIKKYYGKTIDKVAMKYLYVLSTKIIVHSEADKSFLSKTFHINETKINVIFQGFYSDESSSIEIALARKRIGLPVKAKILLFFGTIRRQKGLKILIESFLDLYKGKKDVYLLIAGKPQRNALTEVLPLIKNERNIILRTSFFSKEQVGFYYSSADFLVLPYLEGYATGVGMMSYCYERPIIISRIKQFTEIFGKDSNFLEWVLPGSVSELKRALRLWLEYDPLLLIEKGKKGKSYLSKRYPWEISGQMTGKLYEEILQRSEE